MLKEKNLIVSNSKTEDFQILRDGDDNWKKWKIIGSSLTQKAVQADDVVLHHHFQRIFKSISVNLATKLRVFNGYIFRKYIHMYIYIYIYIKEISSKNSRNQLAEKDSCIRGHNKIYGAVESSVESS